VYVKADGTRVYEIRKQVNGHRYEVSTGATTFKAAVKQLERFESDPEVYRPLGDTGIAPVYLDNDLSESFLSWSLKAQRDGGKENSAMWVEKKRSILVWWMKQLPGVNLRKLSLRDHVEPALAKAKGRAHRIAVLKHFMTYLREERHLVTTAEDATLDLHAPIGKPAQWDRSKVIPREHYLLVREHLTGQCWKDGLTILAGTGWHLSELVRFARGGRIEPLSKATRIENGAVAALVCPMHKSGDVHRTAVSQEVLDAAERLLKTGWPKETESSFEKAIKSACKAAKIPPFTPGRFRHSVATWAVEKGADLAAVSAFLGHKSPQTTKRFYVNMAVVPKVPTLA
jgi:integrase